MALLGHLAFLGLLLFLSLVELNFPHRAPARDDAGATSRTTGKVTPRSVTLREMTPEQWAKNLPKPKPRKESLPNGQVVATPPGNGEEDPTAKYLAESSNSVKEETRSRETTAFYKNAMRQRTATAPQPTSGRDPVDKAQAAGNQGIGNEDRPFRSGKRKGAFEVPDVKPRQEVALKVEPGPGLGPKVPNRPQSDEVTGNSNRLRIVPGSPEGGEESSPGRTGPPGIKALFPSAAVLDRLAGAAPNDKLDAPEGDGTYLNTRAWKYSSFFTRVHQSVGQNWDIGELARRDPTGMVYGRRDRYTLVRVTLDESGDLKDIEVERSCGLEFLDRAAITAFQRAQPFPHPPPGLLATDSTVRFSFGFYVEMGGQSQFRLFRSAN